MFRPNGISACRLLMGALLLHLFFATGARAQIIHPPLPEPLVWSFDGEEGGNRARFVIWSRTEGAHFRYETVDGTAKAGVDYVPVSGSGTNSVEIYVSTPDDGKLEPPKTVKLRVIEEGPGILRTNQAELVIYDNEISRSLDGTFQSDFRPSQGHPLAEVHKFVFGRVRLDGKLVIVEPPGFTIVNGNGKVESFHGFPEWMRSSPWLPAVTVEGNIILGRATVAPGADPALVKILANGERDESFNPQLPAIRIHGLAATREGKILVGFTHPNETDWSVVQLNADGSLDPEFPGVHRQWGQIQGFSFPYLYQHIGVARDGSIQIITPDSYPHQVILKGGAIVDERFFYDASLRPKAPGRWVGDGMVVVFKGFNIGLYSSTALYRLHEDGSLDESFVPGILPTQFAYLGTQADGKVLALADGKLIRLNNAPDEGNLVRKAHLNGGEEDAEAYFLFQRMGDTTEPLTIRVQTKDSVAKAGRDYVHLDALVEFRALDSEASVRFEMIDDDLSEGRESFILKLSDPNGVAEFEAPEFTAFIWDLEPYMQLLVDPIKEGVVRVWKDYSPEWGVKLQASSDLGETWTDVEMSSQNVWNVTPGAAARTRIFRAVKID